MSRIAKIHQDHLPASETLQTINRILLSCAIFQSRQRMISEVSLSVNIDGEAEHSNTRLDLDLEEDSKVGTCLGQIDHLYQADNNRTNGLRKHTDEGDHLAIKYCEDRWEIKASFSDGYASTFDQALNHIYTQLSDAPLEAKLSEIESIRPEDTKWLVQHAVHDLPEPNATDAISLFRKSVQQWSDKVAVEAWDGKFTYSELEHESTRLAEVLVEKGVQAGTIIPLAFEFSKWAVASLLATWKTGAAWVFIEASHPIARLQKLAKQVGASFVLAPEKFKNQLSELPTDILVLEDLLKAGGAGKPCLPASVDTSAPSYVIFTSGSTGEPKAVVHTHFAFCSGAMHQAQILKYTENTRTLQNCPLIFAGAIPELLFTLLRGGCLCVPKQEDRIKDLSGCVRHFQSNSLIISSSSAAIQDPTKFQPRQTLLMGSEPVPAQTARKWSELHENTNGYGSTETNTVATCFPCNTAVSHQSVGRGAAHQYWVVDALNYDRLVPPGWLGEVVVEGHALASCYLNNDEATRKAFPQTPGWHAALELTRNQPTRFFRSGDLGRIASDGTLEIHGRTDPLQIKLRGQRVELGEVEAVTMGGLSKPSPLVAELILPKGSDRPSIAVFLVVPIQSLDPRMLAEHVSISVSQIGELRTLNDVLSKQWASALPAFMRPTYLFPLPQLPRTATGKIDRQSLRRWYGRYSAAEIGAFATAQSDVREHRALETKTEHQVAAAVSKVLSIPEDSIAGDSAFTVLGGDSLSAIQLSQELQKQDLVTSPGDIIQSHDLASLAATLRPVTTNDHIAPNKMLPSKNWDDKEVLGPLSLDPDSVEGIFPTSDSQSRAIELGTGPERCFVYHFVLRFDGKLDRSRLSAVIEKLVDRHDVLRTLFTRHEGRILQVVMRRLLCPLEIQDMDKEQAVEDAIRQATTSDIAIDQVPTKFWLFCKDGIPSTLILRLSHAQFDGLSMPILWDSLARLYASKSLHPAPHYSTYVQKVIQRDLWPSIAYYKDLLSDIPFTDLVKKHPGIHRPQNRELHHRLNIPPIGGFTAAHIFEAAWGSVLAKVSGNSGVVFDHIVSGRNVMLSKDFDIQNLVGACLNDTPVVVKMKPHQTIHQLLSQVRTRHAEALGIHETLGFRSILGKCKPTHWPKNARMTSSVQYRGFEERSEFRIGESRCTVEMVERSMDLEDLTVLVTPLRGEDSGTFDVRFLFSDESVEEAQAKRWFDEMIEAVVAFARDGALEQEVEVALRTVDR